MVLGLWALVFERATFVEWRRSQVMIPKDQRPKTKDRRPKTKHVNLKRTLWKRYSKTLAMQSEGC